MKFRQSPEVRRAIALCLVERMMPLTPSPEDLAALAVEVYEIIRESIAHTVEQHGGSRSDLFDELDRVASEAREAALRTTAVRSAALNARRS